MATSKQILSIGVGLVLSVVGCKAKEDDKAASGSGTNTNVPDNADNGNKVVVPPPDTAKTNVNADAVDGTVVGNGKIGNQTFTVGDFNKIDIKGAFQVDAAIGDKFEVTIGGDENLLGLVNARVEGTTLMLSSDKKWKSDNPLIVKVSLPKIEGLELNGSGKAYLKQIAAGELSLLSAGSGDIYVFGKADKATIFVTGSGSVFGKELVVNEAKTSVTGSGNVEINATKKLDNSITGSGNVVFFGAAKDVKSNITGSGVVSAGKPM